tara:strand:- start:1015 stop:1185 length:171 start_codon:yes stop_codon:yes gene_type:complete
VVKRNLKQNQKGERENNMPYKKYSSKQKKLAAVAPPRKKITGADFKKLKKSKRRKK